ncbi:hypothetical protein Salat_0729500 [Sesamum alatum]|uniref:Retrotransposon Copia-like N-terminal domain-containing protein n=1 Tax=Sesamum alatum TaxID=300844 RepID=A0AAE1YRZ0_9LAMI|nr:hypothetical protein Salat_0729500 [Sesamum alatum]
MATEGSGNATTAGSSNQLGIDAITRLSSSNLETLHLQPLDHSGMVLVSTPLTGRNYLGWNRAVKRAMAAKMKLDFIDRSTVELAIGSDDFKQWFHTDSMEKCNVQTDGVFVADIVRTELQLFMVDEMPTDPVRVNFARVDELREESSDTCGEFDEFPDEFVGNEF